MKFLQKVSQLELLVHNDVRRTTIRNRANIGRQPVESRRTDVANIRSVIGN